MIMAKENPFGKNNNLHHSALFGHSIGILYVQNQNQTE